jgi:arginine decarboxylase
MNLLKQYQTPLFDALKKYVDDKTISFHVPGHKGGRGLAEFKDYIGSKALSIDVNGMEDLDNICNPIGVIRESQALAADAFGADHAHFLVSGTTAGVQAMIMTLCSPGDKLIVPRNAHKSVVGGMILSGAIPVYIQPEIDSRYGFAMGLTPESVRRALTEHPDVKGVFVINPTYYGVASDLKQIVQIAHEAGKPVIVDEAHGAHLGFHSSLPVSAMEAGADMSAVSLHKLGGSMTQSSLLLVNNGIVDDSKVKKILNLTQTTSASYLLMVSIELARKQLALHGRALIDKAINLSEWARDEINATEGLLCMGREIVGQSGCFDFDPTKLVVNVRALGLSGFDTEKLLRTRHHIQIELSNLYGILALVTLGDGKDTVEALVDSLKAIASGCKIKNVLKYSMSLPEPAEVIASPREAFYAGNRPVPLEQAEGEISAEMIMAYPPGIPLVCPGERITREIIEYVKILKTEHCQLQGTEDPQINHIRVLTDVVAFPQDETAQVG